MLNQIICFFSRTLGGSLDENCYCYTLEVSFFSYQPVGFSHPIPYTEEEYMKLGRNLARTFLDYYKLQNHIVFNPTTAIAPKLTNQSFLKSSNTSQNLQSFSSSNNNNNSNGNGIYTNGSSNKNNSASADASSNNQASAKQISSSRSSKTINQTLKPLSSMSLSGNSSSSLNNGKDSNNNNSVSNTTPSLGSQATTDGNGVATAVTFSLN